MSTEEDRSVVRGALAETWVQVIKPILRLLFNPITKLFSLSLLGAAALGRMGENFIYGIEAWVALVNAFKAVAEPLAHLLEIAIQAPILLVASWFDISLALPGFPVWGMDIIVLANIAAGFLVLKRFVSIPAQTLIVLLIVLPFSLLSYSISLFVINLIVPAMVLMAAGGYMAWAAAKSQVELLVWHSTIFEVARDWSDERNARVKQGAKLRHLANLYTKHFKRPTDWGEINTTGRVRVQLGVMLFSYLFVICGGLLVLIANAYADTSLPFWRRLAEAFDAMWIEKVLMPLGLG